MKMTLQLLAIFTLLTTPATPASAQDAEGAIQKTDPKEAAEVADRVHQEVLQRFQKYTAGGGGGTGGGGFSPAPFDFQFKTLAQHSGGLPFVIRSSEPDPKDQAQFEEDLLVMAHLIEKAVDGKVGKGRRNNTALGIDLYFKPGVNPIRSLYLEDYGAVFILNVAFPLLAPPKGDPDQPKPSTSSDWEKARRELYGNRDGRLDPPPAENYDQDQVDNLKEALLESMKNASNIRGLKPDDNITIAITGGRVAPLFWSKPTVKQGNAFNVQTSGPGQPAGSSTLTLRVRKSDVDAFAHNKLSLEEFRKKARWATYVGASRPATERVMGDWGGGAQGENFDVLLR